MTSTTFIYGLNDPLTGECRYVGKSDEPFGRFVGHRCNRLSLPVSYWIESLAKRGLVPTMDLIDEVPVSQWQFWEREYIRVFRAIGVRLLNLADGGEGRSGPHTEQTKEKIRISKTGKNLSESHVKKISLSLAGNTRTKGRPWSAARRAAQEKNK